MRSVFRLKRSNSVNAFRHALTHPCESLEKRVLLASQPYTFQNAAIGGGGFVDGIVYSPTQPNVIYARTDIGGLYKTTNDGSTWQQQLDFVPSATSQMMGVLSVAIDPRNANNLYLDTGEYSGTNGYVLSSSNGGASFTTTNLPFYVGGNSTGRGTGERLAVDPNLGSILFLGSNSKGLYQTANSAASFSANSAFNSLVGSTSGVTFVYFDPRSGTQGSASQIIYVGVNSTAAGSNIYRTTNGGTTWAALAGGPTGLIPMRAALDNDGNLYFTFSNALPPDGSITNGAVWRYNTSTSAWTNISPVIPGVTNGTGDTFGYVGLAVDPSNTGTVVVTSFDRYSNIDTMWRTVNAAAATPTWTVLFDSSSAQNHGYGGYDTTRNTTSAPWVASFGDGIGNWAASVAINPFNSSQLMYGNGQGLWATDNVSNGGTNTKLTAANSWYFPDYGIEFTSALSIAAPGSKVPLYSALGDIGGFAHTTLTTSPAAGNIVNGTNYSIDFAQTNPAYAVVIGSFTNGGAYSSNDGASWTHFSTAPFTNASGGTIAVSSSGASVVWVPSGSVPYYSSNNGISWTASTLPATAPTGSTLAGGKLISDRVNPNYFYYYTENSSDNALFLYTSSDAGHTFTLSSTTATGNVTLQANPYVAGDLWISCYGPLYESTNYGVNFTYDVNSNPVSSSTRIALGKNAPGQTYAALYIWGTISGVTGLYRSDDQARTWVQINDSAHMWGGYVATMAADPSTFGRVYMGFNGRGIILGNPTSSVPAGWTDSEINSPGNPGYATSSTTLSNGTVVNQWTINGGGAGITGTSDQFHFDSQVVTGNYAISTKLTSLTNNGTGTPQAGLIFRAGTSTATDPFAALVQTTAGQLVLESRTISGGSITSTTLAGVPIGAEYLDLVRSGNNFTAYYGTDGVHWTQLGPTIAISAMPTNASAGLAVTAAYNPQLSSATFSNVQVVAGPTIATVATALPNPLTGSSTSLSVLGASTAGESTLVYTWTAISIPPGAATPTFSANGTNAAKNTTAQLLSGGSYVFQVSISDSLLQTITSSITVVVVPTVYTDTTGNHNYAISVSPTSSNLLQIFVDAGSSMVPTYQISLTAVPSLTFNMGAGTDSLIINYSNGNPSPAGGITLNSGSGIDTLSMINASATTPGSVTVVDNGLINFNAGSGSPINVINLASLSFVLGAQAIVAPLATTANRTLLMTGALNFPGTAGNWQATLDLNRNDLIVSNGNVANLTRQAAQGFQSNAGGLISSVANADSTHLAALGVIQNSIDGSSSSAALYSSVPNSLGLFDGTSPANTDVLIKYTYFGDANLDGHVDASDYSRIDSGIGSPATGWFNGDFNYDSVINGSDYTLIDNAFNIQGVQLAAQVVNALGNATRPPIPMSAAQTGYGLIAEVADVSHKLDVSALFGTISLKLPASHRFDLGESKAAKVIANVQIHQPLVHRREKSDYEWSEF